jgi:hypothetical protein
MQLTESAHATGLPSRRRIEAAIETLLALLDEVDGNADLKLDEGNDQSDFELGDDDENNNEPYAGFVRENWEERV